MQKPNKNLKASFILFCCAFYFLSTIAHADTPQQQEQYKYALGLIQRHLYDEAGNILSKLLSEPKPFSHTDGALFWLAEVHSRQNKFQDAIANYVQLIKNFPSTIFIDRAYYGLGWAHENDNNPKSAIEAYEKVSREDLKLWIDVHFKSAYLRVRYEFDPDTTIKIYKMLLKEPSLDDTQKFEANLQVAIATFNKSIFKQSNDYFLKALELAPEEKKQAILYYLADSYYRLKDFTAAASYYSKTIAANPASELAQKSSYFLAWTHIEMKQYDKAIQILERQAKDSKSIMRKDSLINLIELQLNLQKYEDSLEWIDLGIKIFEKEQKAEMYYLRALSLSRIADHERSLLAFDKFINDYPSNKKIHEAHYQKGMVLITLSKFPQANIEFKKISTPETPKEIREKAIYRIGECYFNLGDIKNAIKYFEMVIELFPSGTAKIDALYQLGELAYMQNRFKDALTFFKAIIESNTELSKQAVFRSGEVLMKDGDFKGAVEFFEKYIQQNPKGQMIEDAIFKKGFCSLEMGETAEALTSFSQLIDAEGYFRQEARYQIAEIARELGNYPLAIQHYKAIVTEEPDHPLASWAKQATGISLFHLGDFEAAIKNFKDLINDIPSTHATIPAARYWLGRSLIGNNNLNDGILEILKVPVLYPNEPFATEAYAHAAKAYEKLDSSERARLMWENVLKSNPTEELKLEATKNLEKLKKHTGE